MSNIETHLITVLVKMSNFSTLGYTAQAKRNDETEFNFILTCTPALLFKIKITTKSVYI